MKTDYEDQTVEELREELRDRDLRVSGSKDDLVARLAEDDAARADDGGADDGGADEKTAEDGANGRGRASMRDVLVRIQEELHDVTGLTVERASGLHWEDGEWQAHVEVVEVSRVPPSTDVLATYEVRADGDGALTSFDRVQRYRRSEAMNT